MYTTIVAGSVGPWTMCTHMEILIGIEVWSKRTPSRPDKLLLHCIRWARHDINWIGRMQFFLDWPEKPASIVSVWGEQSRDWHVRFANHNYASFTIEWSSRTAQCVISCSSCSSAKMQGPEHHANAIMAEKSTMSGTAMNEWTFYTGYDCIAMFALWNKQKLQVKRSQSAYQLYIIYMRQKGALHALDTQSRIRQCSTCFNDIQFDHI